MIPKSRLWIVRLRDGSGALRGKVEVFAPNRMFADLNGRGRYRDVAASKNHRLPWGIIGADWKITAAPANATDLAAYAERNPR